MTIKIKKLHADAFIPKYQTAGAACFDLHAVDIGGVTLNEQEILQKHGNPNAGSVVVAQGFPNAFRTGLAFEIPEDHVMLVFSRSGHGFKNEVSLSNCVGVVDSDYRGEVKVSLRCGKQGNGLRIQNGDRIAQALVIPVKQWEFEVVEELGLTERGEKGFGSTGSK